MTTAKIGKHLASLNLFREADGTVEITVASGTGSIDEYRAMEAQGIEFPATPHLYVEMLIVAAATGIPKSFLFKEDMN